MRSCPGQGLNAEARSENRSTPHARRPAATLTTGAGGAGGAGATGAAGKQIDCAMSQSRPGPQALKLGPMHAQPLVPGIQFAALEPVVHPVVASPVVII